jgi:hypothetical protein
MIESSNKQDDKIITLIKEAPRRAQTAVQLWRVTSLRLPVAEPEERVRKQTVFHEQKVCW